MDKNKVLAMLQFGCHVAFIDGVLQNKEKELLKAIADGISLNFDIPETSDYLPSINEIVEKFSEIDEKIMLLEFAINLIAADGYVDPKESEFISKLVPLLNIPDHYLPQIISAINELATSQARWLKIKEELSQKKEV